MRAILFDIDDTLYDQQTIFEQACKEAFGELKDINITDLFKASRYYSDVYFDAVARGEMTSEEMYIHRIKSCVEHFGHSITDEQALKYQERYVYYGTHMKVTEGMKKVVAYCSEHLPVGVITNGPSEHQWRKVKRLGLERWISPENVFVSGDVGASKPDPVIFTCAADRMHLTEIPAEEIVYVGDSYEKDIIGSVSMGWSAIWLDRRARQVPEDFPEKAMIARSEEELYQLIRNSVESK